MALGNVALSRWSLLSKTSRLPARKPSESLAPPLPDQEDVYNRDGIENGSHNVRCAPELRPGDSVSMIASMGRSRSSSSQQPEAAPEPQPPELTPTRSSRRTPVPSSPRSRRMPSASHDIPHMPRVHDLASLPLHDLVDVREHGQNHHLASRRRSRRGIRSRRSFTPTCRTCPEHD